MTKYNVHSFMLGKANNCISVVGLEVVGQCRVIYIVYIG